MATYSGYVFISALDLEDAKLKKLAHELAAKQYEGQAAKRGEAGIVFYQKEIDRFKQRDVRQDDPLAAEMINRQRHDPQ